MSEWKTGFLSEIAEIEMGQSPAGENCSNKSIGLPLLNGPTEFTNNSPIPVQYTSDPKRVSKKGDILFCVRGSTTGKMNWSDQTYAIGRGIAAIRHQKGLHLNRFIRGVIDYNLDGLLSGATGSTFPSVSRTDIENIQIEIPTLPEQERIAEVLSSLDDKIDLLHRQNKTLEEMAETLFRQWLNDNSNSLRMQSFNILIQETIGGEWGKDNIEGEYNFQVSCIRGTDISDLQTGLPTRTPTRFIKEKKFNNISPQDGDLIIEISGGTDDQSTGRVIYIDDINRLLFPYPLVFSNFCRLIRPQKKEYSYFLYLYLQYLYKQDEFFNIENGSSGIKNLDYKFLLFNLEYLLPNDLSSILIFNELVKDYFLKINKNKLQIQKLESLRYTLLPKLMSGVVRVEG